MVWRWKGRGHRTKNKEQQLTMALEFFPFVLLREKGGAERRDEGNKQNTLLLLFGTGCVDEIQAEIDECARY